VVALHDERVSSLARRQSRRRFLEELEELAEEVLGAGIATIAQIDQHLARLEDPDYRGFGFAWIGARGRRST
jgi:hypothetical protein